MLERLNKEIRRRTRVVGIFPNPESYLRLVTVYLMEYSEDWSVTKSYLSEDSLKSLDNQESDRGSRVQSCEQELTVPIPHKDPDKISSTFFFQHLFVFNYILSLNSIIM